MTNKGGGVRTHGFAGRRYRITRWKLDGFVDHPEGNDETWRQINVSPEVSGLKELEIWIHESLHAALPKLSEADVDQSARDTARLVWRLGYRKN